MSDVNIIYELIKEVRDKQDDHSIILTKMASDVEANKNDLEEHMAQTRAVKSLVEQHREEYLTRLEKLEEPSRVLKSLKKAIMWLGSLAAGIAGILKLFGKL